jgi:hypothetical protein
LNSKVWPGATVLPLGMPARRFGASQSAPANGLFRSRGCVVPSLVFASQLLAPTFFSVIDAGRTWFTVIFIVVDANGHDCDTKLAA